MPLNLKTKLKKLSVLSLIIISFTILEGLSRLCLRIDPVFNKIAGDDNSSWRLRWLRNQKSKINTHRFDRYDQTKGWFSKDNLKQLPVFRGKLLNTNSKGLRGSVEYDYTHPLNKKRIVVLGDSFTFGEGVNDNETYCSFLKKMLPQYEILNCGIHGYGHDQMLIFLKEEGLKYNPDIVILGFIYNNIYRNGLKFRDYAKPIGIIENHQLKFKNIPVPKKETFLKWEWCKIKLFDLTSILIQHLKRKTGIREKEMQLLTCSILDEMVSSVKSKNAVPIFIYLPVGAKETFSAQEKFLKSYCQKNNIKYISLLPYFKPYLKKGIKLIGSHGHWTPLGHKIVAHGIKEYLLKENR